jgi:hypothetical protein
MAKEVVVETQGTEDGSDVHESRPQNAEVQVDVLPEEKQ